MSIGRIPRLRVLADGMEVAGVIDAEVISNNYFSADTFRLSVAISADPAAGLSAWADATDALIEVQIGVVGSAAASGWRSLITGRIDSLEADPIRGIARIEGRDLSALMIEARTHEAFANQTASDIATTIAGRHGLAAQVGQTSNLVGRYYSSDHTRTTLDRLSDASTEWDLLVFLAQQEGFDVFVAGSTLYFQPTQELTTPAMVLSANPNEGGVTNVTGLRLERSMTLAADISLTVRSWNSQQNTMVSVTARRARPGSRQLFYTYVRPNLTQDEAMQLAQQKLANLTRHEFGLTATMPGELALSPRSAVALAGTGSSFDQIYLIDSITRRLTMRDGFVQTLRASPASGIAGFLSSTIALLESQ